MPLFHAVVWIDHHSAQILQFDAARVLARRVTEHLHCRRRHCSRVRSEHEFFGNVCDATKGVAEVLVVGSHTALHAGMSTPVRLG